jgi:hypothetical protein
MSAGLDKLAEVPMPSKMPIPVRLRLLADQIKRGEQISNFDRHHRMLNELAAQLESAAQPKPEVTADRAALDLLRRIERDRSSFEGLAPAFRAELSRLMDAQHAAPAPAAGTVEADAMRCVLQAANACLTSGGSIEPDSSLHRAIRLNAGFAAAPEAPEPARPDIIEKLTYHQHERDDMTLDDVLSYLATGWKKVHGRTERQLILQLCALLAGAPEAPGTQDGEAVARLESNGAAGVSIAQVYRPLPLGQVDVYTAPPARKRVTEAEVTKAFREAWKQECGSVCHTAGRDVSLRVMLHALAHVGVELEGGA